MGNTLDYWLNGLRTWRSAYRRLLAADALGRMGTPGVDGLIAALTDVVPEVRLAAARVLGEIGDPRAVDPVMRRLQDSEPTVRMAAAVALGRMGAPATQALIAALADSDADLRRGAARALGETGDTRAVDPLLHALDDPDPFLRMAAADGLRGLGVQAGGALARLKRYRWTERDGGVRVAVRQAIDTITDALRHAPSELEAASAPEGRGNELSSAEAPAGRGTELSRADKPGGVD